MRRFRLLAGAATVILVAGCTTLSADHGFDAVRTAVQERTGDDPRWPRTEQAREQALAEARKLLATPLNADTAVRCRAHPYDGIGDHV